MESSPSVTKGEKMTLSPTKRRSKTIEHGFSLAETLDSLIEKLPKRPSPEDVEKSGIKKSSEMSHTLQPAAAQIEKKLVESRVAQSIKKKVMPASPTSKRIITSEEHVADSLASTAKDLKMRIRADTVAHLLGNRPAIENLKQAGVIDQAAPSISGKRRSLEFGINKSQLHRNLMGRPDYQQLVEKGIVSIPSTNANDGAASMDVSDASMAGKDPSQKLQIKLALGLKCISRLEQLGMIDEDGKVYLKNLIFNKDPKILVVLDNYEATQNLNMLLENLHQMSKSRT